MRSGDGIFVDGVLPIPAALFLSSTMGNELALLAQESPRDPSMCGSLSIIIESASNMPADHLSVEVSISRTNKSFTYAERLCGVSHDTSIVIVLPRIHSLSTILLKNVRHKVSEKANMGFE